MHNGIWITHIYKRFTIQIVILLLETDNCKSTFESINRERH